VVGVPAESAAPRASVTFEMGTEERKVKPLMNTDPIRWQRSVPLLRRLPPRYPLLTPRSSVRGIAAPMLGPMVLGLIPQPLRRALTHMARCRFIFGASGRIAVQAGANPPYPQRPAMKILVADDEPTVRRIMQAFLEKNHHEVVIAEGGRQAFELLKEEGAPHVAIIDWMMPDLSGPEVCAKLRQTKLRIRPYLLMLTSKNGEADLAAGLDAGADDFLTKPFRSAEMLARLRVAERSIGCALEIQERLEEFEALVERHKMLGEMAARPAVEGPAPAAPSAPIPVPTSSPAPEPPPESFPEPAAPVAELGLSADEVSFRTVHALRELGLDATATRRLNDASRPYRISYSAWVGFVLPDRECWVDLLLEADPLSVNTIFAQALQRPASPAAG